MLNQQLHYMLSCCLGRLKKSRTQCPQCGSKQRELISRKKIITLLVQCSDCCLRYRIPQDPPQHHFDFYQDAYSSSLATECPTPEALKSMLDSGFRHTEKNFQSRIEILSALKLTRGARVLDYGASWGYATWQFAEHGFSTMGYEISKPRAKYARDNLGMNVVDREELVPDQEFDCIFSSHVLEHVPAPRLAFDFARRVLRPGGLFVAFTPNGSEDCRRKHPADYDHSWGRLHPLYLNAEFYAKHFGQQPFLLTSAEYGEKYPLEQIANWSQQTQMIADVSKRELLVVVVKM